MVDPFKSILAPGQNQVVNSQLLQILSNLNVSQKLAKEDASLKRRPVTTAEIEYAIKSSNPHKSPGPDGLNAHFYKLCWPIIAKDVIATIKNFFGKGKLLMKQVKHTFITLVPKVQNPCNATEYKPISLTNELYKIIAKILAARVKTVMDKIISPFQ